MPTKTTDETGTVIYEYDTITDFKIQINSVPEGYALPTEKISFVDGTTAIITLEKVSE